MLDGAVERVVAVVVLREVREVEEAVAAERR
jgi:hypothetical protein